MSCHVRGLSRADTSHPQRLFHRHRHDFHHREAKPWPENPEGMLRSHPTSRKARNALRHVNSSIRHAFSLPEDLFPFINQNLFLSICTYEADARSLSRHNIPQPSNRLPSPRPLKSRTTQESRSSLLKSFLAIPVQPHLRLFLPLE